MALPRTYESQNCSIARALEIVGDRWTLLVIRSAFEGVRRFDDFQDALGVARNVLTDRLTRLCDEGIMRRVPYQERPEQDRSGIAGDQQQQAERHCHDANGRGDQQCDARGEVIEQERCASGSSGGQDENPGRKIQGGPAMTGPPEFCGQLFNTIERR